MIMKSKFEQVLKESYKKLFSEKSPDEKELGDNSPENVAIPKDLPDVSTGETSNSDELTGDESALPDPREAETVSIDMLNTFIDFLNLPENEQKKFLKEYGFLDSRANSENFKDKIDALKSISKNDFPDRSI